MIMPCLSLQAAMLPHLSVDLSMAGKGGPRAAEHVAALVVRWPALRPLSLVVKAVLKVKALKDMVLRCIPMV